MKDQIANADNWPLVGGLVAIMSYSSGMADVLVHAALDWFPVVATMASQIAPKVSWLPDAAFQDLVYVLAVVVVLWRGKDAALDTYERFK